MHHLCKCTFLLRLSLPSFTYSNMITFIHYEQEYICVWVATSYRSLNWKQTLAAVLKGCCYCNRLGVCICSSSFPHNRIVAPCLTLSRLCSYSLWSNLFNDIEYSNVDPQMTLTSWYNDTIVSIKQLKFWICWFCCCVSLFSHQRPTIVNNKLKCCFYPLLNIINTLCSS